MPATRLSEQPHEVNQYDVIGLYAQEEGDFVRHVALYDSSEPTVCRDQAVSVAHMEPPLQRGNQIQAHLVGVVPLTNDEVRKIETWIAKVADEYDDAGISGSWGRQYRIDPPWMDFPPTGPRRYTQFSCAGFVLTAYRQARLILLDISNLPEVERDTIDAAYQTAGRDLSRWGLHSNRQPQPVVLPGYLLHALKRPADEIRQTPYRPKPEDARF